MLGTHSSVFLTEFLEVCFEIGLIWRLSSATNNGCAFAMRCHHASYVVLLALSFYHMLSCAACTLSRMHFCARFREEKFNGFIGLCPVLVHDVFAGFGHFGVGPSHGHRGSRTRMGGHNQFRIFWFALRCSCSQYLIFIAFISVIVCIGDSLYWISCICVVHLGFGTVVIYRLMSYTILLSTLIVLINLVFGHGWFCLWFTD